MKTPKEKLSGDQLDEFLKSASDYSMDAIKKHFSRYEPVSLYHNWRLLIRSIDEFLNLYHEIEDQNTANSFMELSFNFKNDAELAKFMDVNSKVESQFGHEVAFRFLNFAKMNYHGTMDYARMNLIEAMPFNFAYVKSALFYYQSKRKYFVTLLDLIPLWAQGTYKFNYINTLKEFQYVIDSCLQTVTTLYYDTVLKNAISDFSIDFSVDPPVKSHSYYNLEGFFLEPQTLTMVDQLEFRAAQTEGTKSIVIPEDKVFSFAEAESNIQMVSSVFQKYEVGNADEYLELSFLVYKLKDYCADDFNICIPQAEFKQHIKPYIHKIKIFGNSNDYFSASNFVSLFQLVDDMYYTSVVLLNRFITSRMQIFLNKNKSFQINSGFVFEDKIRKILENKGFEVTPITRIERKEFDVIAIKGDKIYNFQCKNNLIDISRVQENALLTTRLNKRLVRYYIKAYKKELDRESLITDKLKLDKIEHFVISRYPVISELDYVINFNKLEQTIDRWFS
ncbi:hypothetical protein [Flavobacterium sp. LHD-85]|uniref:hypothetical protein n=1 Tax=Flavobacterium sp. LHD-85 TaxID=3071410 RepID=UPI0027E1B6F8|nr:hypothetical protein [Flavobacterium sp. LHD-85]MDQ6532128.1 hypothetical protein [Flavobacterium sp. LHD-85]